MSSSVSHVHNRNGGVLWKSNMKKIHAVSSTLTEINKNSLRLQPESVYPWINKSHDWKWRLSHEKYGFLHDIVRSNETVNKHMSIMIKLSDPLRLPDIKMELTVEFFLSCNNIPRQLKGQRL